jgi:hypothetical protein
MPLVHETPPSDAERHVRAALANIWVDDFRFSVPPISVYCLSGDECAEAVIGSAERSLWRFFDERGACANMEGNDVGDMNSFQEEDRDITLLVEMLRAIEDRSLGVPEIVSLAIVEVPALSVMAVWEKRDGRSHCFHAYGIPGIETAIELSPEAFHEHIATTWERTIKVDSGNPGADELGG